MEQQPRRINEYTFNPTNQLFEPSNYLGQGLGASLEDLTQGRYTVWANNTIYDTVTNQIITRLGANQSTLLNQYFDNADIPTLQHNELIVQTPTSEINRRFYESAGHAIGASFDAVTSSGVSYHFDLDYGKIAPPGKQLIYNGGEQWRESYQWIPYNNEITDNVVNALYPGFHIATTDEAIEYMLRGMIFGKYATMVQQMIDQGLQDDSGNAIDTVSDAVSYLVKVNTDSVQAARYTYLAT